MIETLAGRSSTNFYESQTQVVSSSSNNSVTLSAMPVITNRNGENSNIISSLDSQQKLCISSVCRVQSLIRVWGLGFKGRG